MPFNVLLLPLLGGYVFLRYWNRTRFSTRRHSGERLLFHAALAGIFLLALAFVATHALRAMHPGMAAWWRGMVPFPYSGTALLALIAGLLAPHPLNLLGRYDRVTEADRAIERFGDYLEKLLVRAVRRLKPVSVTLKGGKVYVGFVTENFDPAYSRQYVTLLPLQSGYRDAADHRVVINTDYAMVYDRIIHDYPSGSDGELDEHMRDLVVVLPVGEIESIHIFDRGAFDQSNAPRGGHRAAA